LVERRSPKPEVVGSSPSAPAKKENMRNPVKFLQEVKQEAFKVTWPTGKETLQGTLMVAAMAIIASIFFLLMDQLFQFILGIILKIGF
jgi:preprotein translocase subunit SecE